MAFLLSISIGSFIYYYVFTVDENMYGILGMSEFSKAKNKKAKARAGHDYILKFLKLETNANPPLQRKHEGYLLLLKAKLTRKELTAV